MLSKGANDPMASSRLNTAVCNIYIDMCFRALDKVHEINLNWPLLCYFFTKTYVWTLVRIVSMRRFKQVIEHRSWWRNRHYRIENAHLFWSCASVFQCPSEAASCEGPAEFGRWDQAHVSEEGEKCNIQHCQEVSWVWTTCKLTLCMLGNFFQIFVSFKIFKKFIVSTHFFADI